MTVHITSVLEERGADEFSPEIAEAASTGPYGAVTLAELRVVESPGVAFGTDKAILYRTEDAAFVTTGPTGWAYSLNGGQFEAEEVVADIVDMTAWVLTWYDDLEFDIGEVAPALADEEGKP